MINLRTISYTAGATLLCLAILLALPALADVEPNDDPASAEEVGMATHTGALNNTDTADYYKFEAGIGQVISIEFASGASENQSIGLLSPSVSPIWTMNSKDGAIVSGGYITSSSTSKDWYYLRVGSLTATPGDYELTISAQTQEDAGKFGDAGDEKASRRDILPGTHNGTLGDEDEYDWYVFSTTPGDVITVSFTSHATEAPQYLDLIDFNDYRRGPSLSSMDGTETSLEFYSSGDSVDTTWFLKVESVRNTGDYTFILALTAQDDGGSGDDAGNQLSTAIEIATGTTLAGAAGGLDDIDAFKVEAGEGDIIEFSVVHAGGGEKLVVTIEDSSGIPQRSGIADVNNSVTFSVMTADETVVRWYYLFITPTYETTAYNITISLDRQTDIGYDGDAPESTDSAWDVPVNGEVSGKLGDVDLMDAYVFTFEGGDALTFTLSSPSGHPIDASVYLDGVILFTLSTTDGSPVSHDLVTADETTGETMDVVIRHKILSPAGIIATYDLVLAIEMQDDCGTGQDAPGSHDDAILIASGSHTGVLRDMDEVDVFYVLVSARVSLTIELTGTAGSTIEASVRSGPEVWVGTSITSEGPAVSATYTAGANTEDDTKWWIWVQRSDWSGEEYGLDVDVSAAAEDTSAPEWDGLTILDYTLNTPVVFGAGVVDDFGIVEARLYYKTGTMMEYQYVTMNTDGGGTSFTVPGQHVTADGFVYYGWATDGFNEATFPASGETSPLAFPPAADMPTIEHTAPGEYREDKDVPLTAIVTSPFSVNIMKVYYRMEGESDYNVLTMEMVGSDYATPIPSDHVKKGTLEYYFVVTNGREFNGHKGSADEPLTLEVKAKKTDDTPGFGLVTVVLALGALVALGHTRRW